MKPQLNRCCSAKRVWKKGILKGGAIIAEALIHLKYPAAVKILDSTQMEAVRVTQPKTPWRGAMSILENLPRSFC